MKVDLLPSSSYERLGGLQPGQCFSYVENREVIYILLMDSAKNFFKADLRDGEITTVNPANMVVVRHFIAQEVRA